MTSVLDAITKLPRYVRIRSSNGIDENNAVELDYEQEKEYNRIISRNYYNRNIAKVRQQHHDYYIRNKQKLHEYYHNFYEMYRDSILAKKKIYNQQPHVKEHNAKHHHKWYLEHKQELNHKRKAKGKRKSNFNH